MTSSSLTLAADAALVVIDLQRGFDDSTFWGRRNNPAAEGNVSRLVRAWASTGRPLVIVRHESANPNSPLSPSGAGGDLKPEVADASADLHITKTVNSAFYGTPDLHAWLTERGIGQVVLAGIQTNMCNETTARMAGNLGHDVLFVLDAMHTFDLEGPDGSVMSADELTRATATSLHGGGFARVVATDDVLQAAGVPVVE
ncbi:cysteine hydrolase family protein [Herbiconiux sp. L3-i23]|uniref:cysteine hydrolase family protein n=1 Tax=Herbiconiux sp. L3-i23 TaxID=2905871 RepID=UPI00206BC3FB|nr:cysteine hydrolase family protein [Herbiconiux sp. L3-i23]BDI22920.1 isochorismatase [Herbiconiux sp. L3-i23]